MHGELGGYGGPGSLVVARIPSVPVYVVASVPKCVPSSTPCVEEAPRVKEAACVSERVSVSEARCVRETACVRSLYEREMTVGMREHATACPSVNVMSRCVSVVARGSLCARVRRT